MEDYDAFFFWIIVLDILRIFWRIFIESLTIHRLICSEILFSVVISFLILPYAPGLLKELQAIVDDWVFPKDSVDYSDKNTLGSVV